MKKIFFLLSMLLAFGMGAQAVPVKPGLKKVLTLADGTTVTAEQKGDEFMGWWETADGRKFVPGDESGKTFVAADLEAMKAQTAERRNLMADARAKRMAAARGGKQRILGGDHITYTGKKKGLIILVNFTDMKFAEGHDNDYYKRVVNTPNFSGEEGYVGSVRDFFYDQSGGKFELDFDIVGPIELAHAYSWYGKDYSSTRRDYRVGLMIKEAIEGADEYVDYADYDWDGDGEADQVFVLYAGLGQASGGDANTIWPHEYKLSYASEVNYQPVYCDGIKVDTYACGNENEPIIVNGQLSSNLKPAGIGTICHEFSHCLGFPDMYDTSGGSNFAMGTWDMMSAGSYNGDGYRPCNYTSWERIYAGWTEPIELTEPATVSQMKSLSDNGRPFIIYNDKYSDEYYLLENRQLTGWDTDLYGKGLLILHVDYSATAWSRNIVNYYADHQRCTIFHADNEDGWTYTSSYEGDAYPYMQGNRIFNDELTDESEPAASLFNFNSAGTKLMGKPITNIRSRNTGLVSFKFMGGNSDNVIDNADPTGISGVKMDAAVRKTGVYSLDGRYLGTDVNALGHGLYIVDGQKVVK